MFFGLEGTVTNRDAQHFLNLSPLPTGLGVGAFYNGVKGALVGGPAGMVLGVLVGGAIGNKMGELQGAEIAKAEVSKKESEVKQETKLAIGRYDGNRYHLRHDLISLLQSGYNFKITKTENSLSITLIKYPQDPFAKSSLFEHNKKAITYKLRRLLNYLQGVITELGFEKDKYKFEHQFEENNVSLKISCEDISLFKEVAKVLDYVGEEGLKPKNISSFFHKAESQVQDDGEGMACKIQ